MRQDPEQYRRYRQRKNAEAADRRKGVFTTYKGKQVPLEAIQDVKGNVIHQKRIRAHTDYFMYPTWVQNPRAIWAHPTTGYNELVNVSQDGTRTHHVRRPYSTRKDVDGNLVLADVTYLPGFMARKILLYLHREAQMQNSGSPGLVYLDSLSDMAQELHIDRRRMFILFKRALRCWTETLLFSQPRDHEARKQMFHFSHPVSEFKYGCTRTGEFHWAEIQLNQAYMDINYASTDHARMFDIRPFLELQYPFAARLYEILARVGKQGWDPFFQKFYNRMGFQEIPQYPLSRIKKQIKDACNRIQAITGPRPKMGGKGREDFKGAMVIDPKFEKGRTLARTRVIFQVDIANKKSKVISLLPRFGMEPVPAEKRKQLQKRTLTETPPTASTKELPKRAPAAYASKHKPEPKRFTNKESWLAWALENAVHRVLTDGVGIGGVPAALYGAHLRHFGTLEFHNPEDIVKIIEATPDAMQALHNYEPQRQNWGW